MKKLIVASLLAGAGAFSSVALAQGYIGVGAGQSDFKVDCAGTSSCDTKDTGYKVFGGWMFTPNFGAEVAYFDLGKAKASGSGDPVLGTFNISGKADGFALYGVALAPFNNFNVFGKLGVSSIKAKVDVSSSLQGSASDSNTSTEFAWGLGAGYEFTKNLGARLEFERFRAKFVDEKQDIDLISLSVLYRF